MQRSSIVEPGAHIPKDPITFVRGSYNHLLNARYLGSTTILRRCYVMMSCTGSVFPLSIPYTFIYMFAHICQDI